VRAPDGYLFGRRQVMKRSIGVLLILAAALSAACGAKKKAVTEADFKATFDGMREEKFTAHDGEKKKAYILAHLGAPHHEDGTKLAWYSAPEHCNYFKFDTSDGNASWGTELKGECEKYAVK
jgi:hypothetical protein